MGVRTLSGGTETNTFNQLPGGTYNIYARYAGDGTYTPSVAAANPSTLTVEAGSLPDGGLRPQHQYRHNLHYPLWHSGQHYG